MKIVIDSFTGEIPRLAADLLPGNAAQKALNCKLWSGELRPLRDTLLVETPTKVGTKQSLYLFASSYWFHWLTDVDAIKGPIAGDTEERTYYTGDGVPKITWNPLAITGGGTDYPINSFSLGVPAPVTKPTVVVDPLGTGVVTGISLAASAVVTAVAHGLETGQKVSFSGVAGMVEINTLNSQITMIDTDSFSCDTIDSRPFNPYASGGAWTRYYPIEEMQTRLWVYTFLSEKLEDGPPSPPSDSFDVGYDQGASLSNMDVPPAGNYNIANKKRVYRTNASLADGTYYLAHRATAATDYVEGTAYTDDLLDSELQEAIPSVDWRPPPADMFGIGLMANGVCVGFSKNEVCFSEPYVPHAWPVAFRHTVGYTIVAGVALEQSVIVLTEGIPYIITGTEPGSMSQTKVALREACVSKRGVANTGRGAIYPSPNGLVVIEPGVARVVTENVFTNIEWKALNPSSMHGYYHAGRYYAFYDTGTVQGVLIYDPASQVSLLTYSDIYATGGYTPIDSDRLYLQRGNDIVEWDLGANLNMEWRSKLFLSSEPIKFKAAMVLADAYPVTMEVWADNILRHTRVVPDNKPFRMGNNFNKHKRWEIVIKGVNTVKRVVMATTRGELSG